MKRKQLSKLSTDVLVKIVDEIGEILEARKKVGEFKQYVVNEAKARHLDIAEFFNYKVTKKVPPKYRHKNDPKLTWAGRGRTPKWIKTHGVKIKQA